MAKQPKPEAYGITVLKAPGGGIVIVGGPIDLSRAESLSPAWTRDVRETRPQPVTTEPDENGRTITRVQPVLTTVGTERIHGESVSPASRRLNRAAGKLLNAAILGYEEASLALLESMQRAVKAPKKRVEETPRDKRLRAERAMGFLGKNDREVARMLKAAGRSDSQVAQYLKERAA